MSGPRALAALTAVAVALVAAVLAALAAGLLLAVRIRPWRRERLA